MKKNQIAILGEGLTGKSIKEFCRKNNYPIVSPEEADLVIASPGIPPEKYPKVDAEIISEIEWAYRLFQESKNPPTLIAVTGTNGKSTVTAMISHCLDAPYAGNIGIPLINYVGLEQEFPCIVVEVSSYQLESCVNFKPNISLLLNIEEDHMIRHKTMDDYAKQKAKIFANQDKQDCLIYNSDDTLVSHLVKSAQCKTLPFSERDITEKVKHLELIGKHNQLNAWVAILAAKEAGQDESQSGSFLKSFKGLRHRLEQVESINNRVFYNDSKATNFHSTLIAVDSFDEPIHLLMCGENKGLHCDDFIKSVQKKCSTITVFGDLARHYSELSKQINPNFPIQSAQTLKEAVKIAYDNSKEGDIILFSPSSSSYDQFNGFEDRGDAFIAEVAELYDEILV